MASNIKIDNLAAEITLAVKEYTEDVSAAVEKELSTTSNAVLKEVKATSPVETGEYKKGWTRKKETTLGGEIKYVIHNKTKGPIAHLLEFGHAKVGGGRVEAIPHIRPAYDKHVPDMEERIKRIIRNGG
ncbi:HK97 gp10 family phage protein [Desulfofalx alkaliphila]|uniref:HK97 gp10 family phage protein n=1 Tax=Desulfofalx alkaliphila TaxID=105483 RepID=UPI0004E10635|nr:HK97 gp10 family phage protein [Desulfofalx alkaliphila]